MKEQKDHPITSEEMNESLYKSGQERFMDYLHSFFENEDIRNRINNCKNNQEVIDVIKEARDFIPVDRK